jgi:hypothetical protein
MAEYEEGQFAPYEVGADEGGYEGEPEGDPYGDETYDLLEEAGVIDEYGDVDPGALANFVESVRQVHNETAESAQWQALDEAAQQLETLYPALKTEEGLYAAFRESQRIHGVPATEEAFEEFLYTPEAVAEAAESMRGGDGQMLRLWHEQHGDPGKTFWTSGGSGVA